VGSSKFGGLAGRYWRIWVLPDEGDELSIIGKPSWIEGTIWDRAAEADAVETWMKGSAAASEVVDRHSLSPRKIDRLQRSLSAIVAVVTLSIIGGKA
jgi:hypothetical protein